MKLRPQGDLPAREFARLRMEKTGLGLVIRGRYGGLLPNEVFMMKPKCLMFVTDGFEDMEVLFTMHRFREAGYQVVLASLKGTPCTGLHGYQVHPDSPIRELNPVEYEWLVIPGGACSEKLRLREEVLDIARTLIEDGRKVASIGRGAQVLLSAGAIDAKRIACPQAIRDDIRASGGIWADEPSVSEGNLHSCRSWQDLPSWFQKLFGSQLVAQRSGSN